MVFRELSSSARPQGGDKGWADSDGRDEEGAQTKVQTRKCSFCQYCKGESQHNVFALFCEHGEQGRECRCSWIASHRKNALPLLVLRRGNVCKNVCNRGSELYGFKRYSRAKAKKFADWKSAKSLGKPKKKLVGPTRFELVTFCTPSKRATSLRYGPAKRVLNGANDSIGGEGSQARRESLDLLFG